MRGCLGFGDWAGIVRGDLPAREGYGAAAHLLGCEACRERLAEARRLDEALGAVLTGGAKRPDHSVHEDLVALAAALARKEFPPEAWACDECTEILLASIVSTSAGDVEPTPLRAPKRRVRPAWLASALAAAAVLLLAVLAVTPPSQGWARTAGLRRGQLWLLPSSIAADVERAVATGEMARPRFTLPSAREEVERESMRGEARPRARSPRWETVQEVRPTFRWDGEGATRAEILLLDQERRFLRSFEPASTGRMDYPASAPPLAPGRTYYWKVNLLGDDDVRASDYVGFAVLDEEEGQDCERRLSSAGGTPFVEAVVAERCGLYSRAVAAFERAAQRATDPEIARRLAREVRRRQGLEGNETRD